VDIRKRACSRTLGIRMSRIRAWLDSSPIADLAMTFMREATGRPDPIEPLRPTHPAALAIRRRVAFWSLVGRRRRQHHRGSGRPSLRRRGARTAPRRSGSLGTVSGATCRIEAATISDALVQPGRSDCSFHAGQPCLSCPARQLCADGWTSIASSRSSTPSAMERPSFSILGAGADSLDAGLAVPHRSPVHRRGARASQLQAVFCALTLVRDVPCAAGLVVVGAADEDADLIAERTELPLLGAIPADPYLAEESVRDTRSNVARDRCAHSQDRVIDASLLARVRADVASGLDPSAMLTLYTDPPDERRCASASGLPYLGICRRVSSKHFARSSLGLVCCSRSWMMAQSPNVLVNSPTEIFVDVSGVLNAVECAFDDAAKVSELAASHRSRVVRELTIERPYVDARMARWQSSNAVIAPGRRYDLSIRKFRRIALGLSGAAPSWEATNGLAADRRFFYRASSFRIGPTFWSRARTGTGKSTLLRSLAGEILPLRLVVNRGHE